MADVRVPSFGPGERAKFVPNYREFREFMRSEQMRDVTEEVTDDIREVARARTPVGDGRDGHMRDKWKTTREGGLIKVNQAMRVMCLVENDDPESALVEFGSKNNPRSRLLAKAGAAFGDFKSKKGLL